MPNITPKTDEEHRAAMAEALKKVDDIRAQIATLYQDEDVAVKEYMKVSDAWVKFHHPGYVSKSEVLDADA